MEPQITTRRRPGIALPLTLMAIVVLGALVVGAFIASTQEYRIGRGVASQERALAAAEQGQASILATWNPTLHARLKTGDTLRRVFLLGMDGTRANVEITKLNTSTYWVVSEGAAGWGSQTGARRRTGLIMRLEIPDIKALGALTARGRTVVKGSVTINGNDSIPAGWGDCPPDLVNKPGIVNKDPLDRDASCATCIYGSPQVADDYRAGDTTTYFNYGITNYAKLTAQATKVYDVGIGPLVLTGINPVALNDECQIGLLQNWGDPARNALVPGPCESYFPIIHSKGPGTLKITTGSGQGALFVDGDLELSGNFTFVGLVIVRGSVKMTGTGNKIVGAVMAAMIEADDSAFLAGNSGVQYSSCAVNTTVASVGRLDVAVKRSWADMY
jgi:hypothetical protein